MQFTRPYQERTTILYVPMGVGTGLDKVHPAWAGTFILDACIFLFPSHQLCTATAYQPPCLNWNFANGRTDADIAMESASELPDTPALCTCGHALLRRGAMSNLASPPLNGIYIKKNIIRIKKILLESKKYYWNQKKYSRTGEGRKEGRKERRNEGNVFVQMYVMLQPAPTPQRSGLWSSIPPLGGGGVTHGISSA